MNAHNDAANGIDRNDDGTHGPEHLTDEEIRTRVDELLDRSEEWTNYGDVNPKIHGGKFIQYHESSGTWYMIETMDRIDDEFTFFDYYIGEGDIFVDGDPAKGWSDAMVTIFESLGMSEVEYDITNPDILREIQYYIVDLPFHARISSEYTHYEGYWNSLESKGVTVDKFRD